MMKKIISSLFIGSLMFSCAGKTPSDLGIKDGKLKACPKSPNCVSSMATKPEKLIQAKTYADKEQTYNQIIKILKQRPRTEIIKQEGNYIYATEASKLIGFVDDIEFYFAEGEQKLHFRSASRVGRSDFGVNRERIEAILKQL